MIFKNKITVSLESNPTHVFLLAGQSNMRPATLFTGNPSGTLKLNNVYQWGRFGADDGVLIKQTIPLQNLGNDTRPEFGPGIPYEFAKRYKFQYPRTNIVFIPCAVGGTGFRDNHWNVGDVYYNDAVNRTNACISNNPSFEFKGVLWHQGEDDAGYTPYETSLDATLNGFRNDITSASSTTPIILGGLLKLWVDGAANRQVIQDIIEDTPNRIADTAYASSYSPTILTDAGDGLHFNSSSSLELGLRYFNAYQSLL